MTRSPRALGAVVAAAFALVVTLVTSAREAQGAQHRVAVIDAEELVVHALDVALSPWDVAIDEHAIAPPGATMPMAVERARELARETEADAVVWLSSSDGGYALWVYDADSDRASARRLPSGPPFNDTTAAGIALSVKTLLRATVIAPPRERFGAAPEADRDPTFRFDLSFGSAARTGNPGVFEPRGGVGVSLWPASLGHHLGVVVAFEGGSGIRVANARFTATVLDLSGRVALAGSWRFGRLLAIEPSLGAAAHAILIDGFVVADESSKSVQRLDPAIEPRLAFDFATFGGRVHVAPWIGVAYMTRSQEILVHGVSVFDQSPLVAEAALRLSIGVE
jgi:hypothetical protein